MDQAESPVAPSTGKAIAAAMDRAAYLMATAERRLRIRLTTDYANIRDGLVIKATIAAMTGPELEALEGKGIRVVRWTELDSRAGELVALVDEAVAEIEAVIAAAPAPPPSPSLSADDLETEAYETYADQAYAAMTKVASELLNRSGSMMSPQLAAEAIAVGALRVAALAGHGGRLEPDDLKQSLGLAVSDVRRCAAQGERPLEKARFDA